MSGFDLKEQVQPISEKTEKEIIGSVIAELRKGMALKLETAPILTGRCRSKSAAVRPKAKLTIS
jgi:hypothetical protein